MFTYMQVFRLQPHLEQQGCKWCLCQHMQPGRRQWMTVKLHFIPAILECNGLHFTIRHSLELCRPRQNHMKCRNFHQILDSRIGINEWAGRRQMNLQCCIVSCKLDEMSFSSFSVHIDQRPDLMRQTLHVFIVNLMSDSAYIKHMHYRFQRSCMCLWRPFQLSLLHLPGGLRGQQLVSYQIAGTWVIVRATRAWTFQLICSW